MMTAGGGGKTRARVTIDDVARKADAHRSTVSRALRGDVRIPPHTRDRIQRIAEELHYQPSLLAKGLAGGGTRTVGILTPRLRDGFYIAVVARQQELLLQQDFCALMGMTSGGYGPPERQTITNLVNRGVDALIMNHVPGDPKTNDILMRLAAGGLPIALLGTHRLKGIDCVAYDTSKMVEDLVAYLAGIGHRRIGIVTWSTHSRRAVGYASAVARAGIPECPEYVFVQEDPEGSLLPLAKQMLALRRPPTALITIDDNMAAHLVMTFEALGVRVPEDISVTGFDDSWFAELCRVPLTTMRLPKDAMGETLVRLVLDRVALPLQDRAGAARRIDLAGELVVRASTAHAMANNTRANSQGRNR